MSKERGEKDLERVQEYASSIQIQVTHLQSQVRTEAEDVESEERIHLLPFTIVEV